MATASSGLTALLKIPCLIRIVNLPWMAAPMATASSGLTALLGVLLKISPCPNPDCELTLDGGAHGHSLGRIDGLTGRLAKDLLALIRILYCRRSPWPHPDCELPKISPCPNPDCELTLDCGAHGHSLIRNDGLAGRLGEDLLALIRIVNCRRSPCPNPDCELPKIFLP
jgi:hypothetical protein